MDHNHPINVIHPRRLPLWRIPAERQALGIAGDYKPTLAMLPDGEIVMASLYMETKAGEFREYTPFWRSSDGGLTWSDRIILPDVLGREQWLTATSKGTLFMSSHFLPQDAANTENICHSFLHRSTDGGRSWDRTTILLRGDERAGAKLTAGNGGHTSRNVVELNDGTLLFGVAIGDSSVAYMWRSTDNGETWDHGDPVSIGDYNGKPYDNLDAFFAEDFTFLTKGGKLLHWIRCGPPSPMYPILDGRAIPQADDNGDRTMLCESTDDGRTWSEFSDFGDYGRMYIRVIRLRDGRLLMTYTQRSQMFPPMGLHACFSHDDGETWDLENDTLILEAKTPWCSASGGSFGNTLELEDGKLLSAYTYRGTDGQTHLEVMRWQLPVCDTRPFFFALDDLKPDDETKRITLHDWAGENGGDFLPVDRCQREDGPAQCIVTREPVTIGSDTFDATIEYLTGEETGDPIMGLSFHQLPVTGFVGCLGVVMQVHNPTDNDQEILFWVREADTINGTHRVQTVAAHETSLIYVTTAEMQGEMELSTVRDIVLLAMDPDKRNTFHVGSLYLVKA